MTKRFLVDASTLIALSACGHLDLLPRILGNAYATQAVLDEVLVDRPGAAVIQKALGAGWLRRLNSAAAATPIPGLGPGEAEIIAMARSSDVVILGDRAARMEALSRGLRVTGLLGILVHGVQIRKITRQEGLAILDELARGSFRMSADLYHWTTLQMDPPGKGRH